MHALPRLAVFTSEDAHYSVVKMATLMGLGSENVRLVRADARGRMDATHLEELVTAAREEGLHPLMVSATAGTTVLGAYDPVEALADACRRHNMWLHVDAAWGGGALMSRRRRHLLRGVHRADSVTWNPHKLLAAPQQCSTFLTRHPAVLSAAHSAHAAYLFQPDKFYDTRYDTGDKHVQCGRRADVLKFWFMWKAKVSGRRAAPRSFETCCSHADRPRERYKPFFPPAGHTGPGKAHRPPVRQRDVLQGGHTVSPGVGAGAARAGVHQCVLLVRAAQSAGAAGPARLQRTSTQGEHNEQKERSTRH